MPSRSRSAARTLLLCSLVPTKIYCACRSPSTTVKLLEAAMKLGLEGIVSKRREQPYRSGPNSGWVKVKTAAWREADRDRWEMFERS